MTHFPSPLFLSPWNTFLSRRQWDGTFQASVFVQEAAVTEFSGNQFSLIAKQHIVLG